MKKRVVVGGLVLLLAAAMSGLDSAPSAAGAAFPRKPVTMIVNFPAGSAPDVTGRKLANEAKPFLSQPIVVVNRAGGTGTIGATEVVKASPDGHTIGISPVAPMMVQPHLNVLAYKGPESYQPIIKLVYFPNVISVKADAPWKTIQELLDHIRANPEKIRVGMGGIGSIPHMNLELLKERAQLSITLVPFQGDAESFPALLGGHVEAMAGTPSGAIGHVKAGRVRILATFEDRRNPLYPDAPTFKEIGYDISLTAYQFIFAPKGIPVLSMRTLHDALKRAMDTDAFKKFAADTGMVIDYKGPAELRQELERDFKAFGDLVDKLKLKTR